MSYINWKKLNDAQVVSEIGKQLKLMRLNRNFSQSQIADLCGIDRVTISKMENGRPANLLSWVQLMRALNKLDVFDSFIEENLDKKPKSKKTSKEKTRLRASSNKGKKRTLAKGISFEID